MRKPSNECKETYHLRRDVPRSVERRAGLNLGRSVGEAESKTVDNDLVAVTHFSGPLEKGLASLNLEANVESK